MPKPAQIHLISVLAALLLAGCASDLMHLRDRDRDSFTATYPVFSRAISLDRLSVESTNFLNENALYLLFEEHPEAVLSRLYRSDEPQSLAVLADLAFYLGFHENDPERAAPFFLTALEASYRGLLTGRDDAWFTACYNISLWGVFNFLNSRELTTAGHYRLAPAVGLPVEFQVPAGYLGAPLSGYAAWQACAEYEVINHLVFGFRRGLGLPLLAALPESEEQPGTLLRNKVFFEPVTLFLRFAPDDPAATCRRARLEFINTLRFDQIGVSGREFPLAQDLTTAVADGFSRATIFHDLMFMFYPEEMDLEQGLYRATWPEAGQIPVIFTHGLMSSPRTWSQMLNSLYEDPRLARHCQFRLFAYPTGNPLLYSARLLRQSLDEAAALWGDDLLPPGSMVLVGHSMGGLLTKALITTSDEAFAAAMVKGRLQLTELSDGQKAYLKSVLYFEPVPRVGRVLFLATPHRGSSMADWSLTRWASGMITMPTQLVGLVRETMAVLSITTPEFRLNTGLDNLAPDDLALTLLGELPISSAVPYYTVAGNRLAAVAGGDDGVVLYTSAHLDGAAGELMVKSNHSVQLRAETIARVKQLLIDHLIAVGRLNPDGSDPAGPGRCVPEEEF